MLLETERLLLREMNEGDYTALYRVLADPEIMQHYPYTFDEARIRGWISRNMERYRIFGFGLWAVCLKETGEMIGDCGLTMQLIGGVIKPEIGYHIRRDQQRKGFAREAASAVRDWAFRNTPFREIYSYMKYTNEPSARSAMSWGCRFVEEFEDEVNEKTRVYRITREEWEALQGIWTERLILRRWKASDAESLFEYAKDPEVGPAAGWPPHRSVEESAQVIRDVFGGAECYAICKKGTDRAIGAIELKLNGHTDMTVRDDECELGYWLGKPFWGRGYMPEAARALIRRGFEELGMTTIWCGYYDGNGKSQRVQEKVGFRYHHTTPNLEVPLLNEVRTGHVSILTRENWKNRE